MKIFLLFLILIITIISSAYSIDDKKLNKLLGSGKEGTEFWFSPTPGFNSDDEVDLDLYVYILSEKVSRVIIEIQGSGYSDTIYTSPYVVSYTIIPRIFAFPYAKDYSAPEIPDNIYTKKAVHISSDCKIIVNCIITEYAHRSGDGFLVLPVDKLGNGYICSSYSADIYNSSSESFTFPTLCSITATQDSTHITFKMSGEPGTKTAGGLTPGKVSNIILNTGDVYLISTKNSNCDLAGSRITSDKPVAVVSGNMCSDVPLGNGYCNYSTEMELPSDFYGKIFPVPMVPGRKHPGIIRIFPSDSNTTIFKNGIPVDVVKNAPGSIGKSFFESRITDFNDDTLQIAVYSTNKSAKAEFYNPGSAEDTAAKQYLSPFWMSILPYEKFTKDISFIIPERQGELSYSNNIQLIYQSDENGNPTDDMEIGKLVKGKLNWDKLSNIYPSQGKLFPYKINGVRLSLKSIQMPYSGYFRIKSINPFFVYSTGGVNYMNFTYGFPAAISDCGFDTTFISKDTLPPIVTFNSTCYGIFTGIATDMPEDLSISGNVARILLDTANSYNISPDYIDTRYNSHSVNWNARVYNRNIPGHARLIFYDNYDNSTVQELNYEPGLFLSGDTIQDTVSLDVHQLSHTITVTNKSNQPYEISKIFIDNSYRDCYCFVLDTIGFPVTIFPNDSFQFKLNIYNKCYGFQHDDIYINDPCETIFNFPISFYSPASRDSIENVSITPMKINFGKIPPESVALQYFIFKNNSFYYESNLDFNILRNRKIFHAYGELKMAPQQTHLDTITFQDSIPGIYTDTISVIFYTGKIVYMPVYGEIVAINDIGEITPNNDISLEIIPSPTYSKSTLKFKLINAGFIDCDLVDINGNTIQNIFSYKYFEAGANEYFLDFGSITNGVYFLRVKIDGKYYSKKVNILR